MRLQTKSLMATWVILALFPIAVAAGSDEVLKTDLSSLPANSPQRITICTIKLSRNGDSKDKVRRAVADAVAKLKPEEVKLLENNPEMLRKGGSSPSQPGTDFAQFLSTRLASEGVKPMKVTQKVMLLKPSEIKMFQQQPQMLAVGGDQGQGDAMGWVVVAMGVVLVVAVIVAVVVFAEQS